MGFSPKSYTFMAMSRLNRADSRRETSILRIRLVPSKSIRRYKFSETAEENKVEQATGRHFLVIIVRVVGIVRITL